MRRQSLRSFVLVLSIVLGLTAVGRGQTDKNPDPEKATTEQEVEIRQLIDQLAISDREAPNPKKRIQQLLRGEKPEELEPSDVSGEDYQKRSEVCRDAFRKLTAFKKAAFPFLVEHLNDRRQSVAFRNHYLGEAVGDACYHNICMQLDDLPENYSSYGYKRRGRDGKEHVRPDWDGTFFDEAGGLAAWLEKNKELSYAGMQIECLRWHLEKEKEIGAPDADSYFLNILLLEVRILERRLENGEDVKPELDRQSAVLKDRDISGIPIGQLSENAMGDAVFSKRVADVLKEVGKIKPGMARGDLLEVFTTEGGISTPERRTFVHQGCTMIKVDVEFSVTKEDGSVEERPSDRILKISKRIAPMKNDTGAIRSLRQDS